MRYYPHLLRVQSDELPGQFRLSRTDLPDPTGWKRDTHGPWTLQYSDPLPCIRVLGPRGELAGWLLGHVITEDGQFLATGNSAASPRIGPEDDFGEFADRLNGRFLAIDLRPRDPRIFPDGHASLAAVYAEAEQCMASTSYLVPLSDATPFLIERIVATDIPYRDAMYPLGLTPRAGVERLLPNHVLDLGTWQLERRWPLGPYDRSVNPNEVVQLVDRSVRAALNAVHAVFPLDLTLTAGRDSRMMLACARMWQSEISTFTCDTGDESSWRDATLATRIARRAGVPHRVETARSSRRDLRNWVIRTGGETGEPRGWRHSRAFSAQSAGRATITGAAAWLSGLEHWQLEFLARPMTPDRILGLCNAPLRTEYLARVERWLEGLPPLDQLTIMDLFYLEQRQGCWAGTIEYGELGASSARLCPTTSATIVHAELRLPVDYRLARGLHHDVIARNWPELLEFPFNADFPTPVLRSRVFALRAGLARRTASVARAWRQAWSRPGGLLGRRSRPVAAPRA